MYRQISETESHLRYGVHSEWNVRNLQVRPLMFGRTYVSWLFVDDGPAPDNRRRHESIPMTFVLPAKIDWRLFKVNLYYHLEKVKAFARCK